MTARIWKSPSDRFDPWYVQITNEDGYHETWAYKTWAEAVDKAVYETRFKAEL